MHDVIPTWNPNELCVPNIEPRFPVLTYPISGITNSGVYKDAQDVIKRVYTCKDQVAQLMQVSSPFHGYSVMDGLRGVHIPFERQRNDAIFVDCDSIIAATCLHLCDLLAKWEWDNSHILQLDYAISRLRKEPILLIFPKDSSISSGTPPWIIKNIVHIAA